MAALLAAVTGCGGSTTGAQPPAHTSATPTATKTAGGTCRLKTKRDVIVRTVAPGLPAAAQVIGDVDLAQCRPTMDTLPAESPHEAGYCTQAAYADDNPGYNADATPARRLKKVVVSVGPACR